MKKITKIGLYLLAAIKSFFFAVSQVAWGLLSIFGLNIALMYMIERHGTESLTELNPLFIKLESIIITNILWFVLAFFLLYSFLEIKEVNKK